MGRVKRTAIVQSNSMVTSTGTEYKQFRNSLVFVTDRITPRNTFLAKQKVSQPDNKYQILDGTQTFIALFLYMFHFQRISQIHNI